MRPHLYPMNRRYVSTIVGVLVTLLISCGQATTPSIVIPTPIPNELAPTAKPAPVPIAIATNTPVPSPTLTFKAVVTNTPIPVPTATLASIAITTNTPGPLSDTRSQGCGYQHAISSAHGHIWASSYSYVHGHRHIHSNADPHCITFYIQEWRMARTEQTISRRISRRN